MFKPATNRIGLLRHNYPQVYRMAVALCGNPATANNVAKQVLQRGAAMFKTWESDDDATRWFARFTVLNSRRYKLSNLKRDALLSVTTDPEIIGMIYAVRQLPMQQREAFLLHCGEGMQLRQLATAMDCSSAAAATHLEAAGVAMRMLSPGGTSDFTSVLPKLLGRLIPPPQELELQIRSIVRQRRLSALVRYAVLWPAGLFLLAAAAWEAWHLWQMIVI